MPEDDGIPPVVPGIPSTPPGVPEDPGIPGMPGNGEGIGGICVPLTDTSTSIPSSPSLAVLFESPDEPDELLLVDPPVGMDDPELPEDDAVPPGLELLEPERDELELEGMEGMPLELEDDAPGIEGVELLLELDDEELLLELDDDEDDEEDELGIEGEELELLWLCVWQPASITLKAEAAIKALIGNATDVFMRTLRYVAPLCHVAAYVCRYSCPAACQIAECQIVGQI